LREPLKVALMAERLGNYGEAATLYERERAYAEAGRNYERAGQLAKAAQMYQLAGDIEGAERCYRAQGETVKLAELCLQRGELTRAAEIYQEMGDLLRAAEIYLEAGMPRKAGELYERMEAWDRALELYRQLGDRGKEALCLERLGKFPQAAEVYEQAAKELVDAGGAEEEIARLYRRAADCYKKGFEEERWAQCRREVIRYEKLPDIVVRVKQEREFVFQETNILSFEVQNDGFGLAYDIELRISGKFEEEEEPLRLRGLRPKQSLSRLFAVKPLDIGEQVPIWVEVSYTDEHDRHYTKRVRKYVDVRRERTPEKFVPRYVMVQGDFIQAQQYRKGDSVEIIRGERRVEVREEGIARCQQCGSELEAGYKFCPKCGYKV
jgi:tetratricopeptide (TPR) repeat protein